MRYTTFITVSLCFVAATALGQQPSAQQSASPQREHRRESDASFIARERAAWNAVKDADSAAVLHAIGASPYLYFVSSGGVVRASAAQFAGAVTKCDTRSSKLDMFNVIHPNDDTATLIYRVTIDRRCGTAIQRGFQQMAMTVWVRLDGRWQAVAQSLVPLVVGSVK